MKTKTVFYLRILDAKNRRYWRDSQNYNTVFESVYDRGVRMVNYLPLTQIVEERIYEYE